MTISNYSSSVYAEGPPLREESTAQQRLLQAEAAANELNYPDWKQIASDGIYRYGYIIAVVTQALKWKAIANQQLCYQDCWYKRSVNTLFVQTCIPGCLENYHLRGQMVCDQDEGALISIDISGNGKFPQVGQYLSTLGEEWANWRLLSLEVAEEVDF